MKENLKVVAVGGGYFSQFHFDAWNRCPEVELIAVCDLDLEVAKAIAGQYETQTFTDVATMLDATNPNLLDIISPPATHLALIALAAERGINVVCQKPFCGTLEAARSATELGEKAGIDITVHENFRFQPWYKAIRTELDAGRLGKVYQAGFRLRPGDGQGANAYLDRQPYFQTMERFLVHETAIHLIDVFRYLFGDVEKIWADLARHNPAIAGEDNCLVVMNFSEGVRGVLDGNRLSDHKAENLRRTMGEMLIEGANGSLELNGDGALSFRAHGSTKVESIPFDWKDHGFGGDCVYRFTRHLVDHYTTGTGRMNAAREYLANLATEEAIYDAASDGVRRSL